MKLIELLPALVVMNRPIARWRTWLGQVPKPLVHYRPHRRRSWGGHAYAVMDDDGFIRIRGNGVVGLYALSFDDLMAEDWEAAPDVEADRHDPQGGGAKCG